MPVWSHLASRDCDLWTFDLEISVQWGKEVPVWILVPFPFPSLFLSSLCFQTVFSTNAPKLHSWWNSPSSLWNIVFANFRGQTRTHLLAVTHPSTNRAGRRTTMTIKTSDGSNRAFTGAWTWATMGRGPRPAKRRARVREGQRTPPTRYGIRGALYAPQWDRQTFFPHFSQDGLCWHFNVLIIMLLEDSLC